jgi:transglutaminase-like putative cysteine protease
MPLRRYSVLHTTRYVHHSTASAAWQALHLQPRHEAAQHCEAFELQVAPHPTDLTSRIDYFGNKQHLFTLREPHQELTITSRSLVRREAPAPPEADATPLLGAVPERVDEAVADDDFTLEQFRHASALVPLLPEARALGAELAGELGPGTRALTWFATVGARFSDAFRFDREATQISTPMSEVLEHRRGVCQDFAHLFLSCLRQHGFPAAYVSGYLLTRPPAGQPRLIGADASHAWVSAYFPGAGWVDYDPTNACFAGGGHIVIARGRDFYDVSPVKGLFSGGGGQELETGVTVQEAT